MDDRVHRHAALLVDHCLDSTAAEDVLIVGSPAATDLITALYREIGARGGRPMGQLRYGPASRAYQEAVDPEDVETADHERAAIAAADAVVLIGTTTNPYETSDISSDVKQAISEANWPVRQERLDTRWVITTHPTAGGAQLARLSTDTYRSLVYDAIETDWERQRLRQQRIAERIDDGSSVRIESSNTDLTMSIEHRTALNDTATRNMPGGEVATSPVVDSVDGTVHIDMPFIHRGERISDVLFTFEDGTVVDCDAGTHQATVERLLDRDEGARRLGELGIGMNDGIDRPTTNMLLDEKIAGTIHLALGFGFEECMRDDDEPNESAVHTDMLVDMREESQLSIDGDPLLTDGRFWFEDD